MNGNAADASPKPHADNNGPVRGKQGRRDKHGRRDRQPAGAGPPAGRISVFDDRIIEGALPPATQGLLLHPESSGSLAESVFSPVIAAEPPPPTGAAAEISDPVSGTAAPRSWASFLPFLRTLPWRTPSLRALFGLTLPRRSLSPRLRLFGGALLLLGAAVVVFNGDYFGSRQTDAPPPPTPPTIVAPVVVPPVPKPTVRHPAARAAVVMPPRITKETATTPAVVAIPREKPDEEGLFAMAEVYLRGTDDNHAEAIYRRILNEGTQKGRAALALGDLAARRNDFANAQEFYRQSKRHFQDSDQSPPQP